MKYKTTRKAVVNGYSNVYSAGYCALQSLLNFVRVVAYTEGTYGWNFDVYEFGNVAICTGYRGMPGTPIPYDLCREYEERAQTMHTLKEMDALVSEFVDRIKSL